MKSARAYGGIDRFRLIADFLIVGIHTSPFSSISEEFDFLAIHVFARIAVPFFLMVTGYFLLPQYFSKNHSDITPLIGYVKKTCLLYAGTTLLYFPISVYAGYYSDGNIAAHAIRNILFDGTFYHLWYLPASIIGVVLFYLLCRKLPLHAVLGVTVFLYIIGLFGDSYYGFTSKIPILKAIFDIGFHLFSYTRNGLFYAPVFLALGAMLSKLRQQHPARIYILGFAASMALMLVEGALLRRFGYQRHDSMYIALIPCMFFLFSLLLTDKSKALPALRDLSMWIYILHPLFIIGVRGLAKLTGLASLLIENSLVHYFAVCLLTLMCAVVITVVREAMKSAPVEKGRAWIELDMDNLRHNVNALRGILPDRCELMPAVKANAYGHGAAAICRELNRLGVRAFCVASVSEGVELRKQHIDGEILVLGYTHPEQFHLLNRYRLLRRQL